MSKRTSQLMKALAALILTALVAVGLTPTTSNAAAGTPATKSSTSTTIWGNSGHTAFTGAPSQFAHANATNATGAVPSPNETKAANCPPGVSCQIVIAGLADGGCNWSPASRPNDLAVYGINLHTTEGSVESALAEAQDTTHCVSWNYLIGPDGTIYVSVPVDSLAYDVSNWWENTHYVEIEQAGYSEDCSTVAGANFQAPVTAADYKSLVILSRWLVNKFHIKATPTTITGHASVPGVSDGGQANQHWDPGVCWPWAQYLSDVGATITSTTGPGSSVVTVNSDNTNQSAENCPGVGFTNCTAGPSSTNFLAVYTQPSTSSPLVSDPYLHPDASAGSDAEQDWGDKAETGHSYVVYSRATPGWLEIYYGGGLGWIQDSGNVTVNTTAFVVTPKGASAPVYGRPMPEYNASGWASIPYDHQQQVALSKYSIGAGQMYPVGAVPRLSATSWPGQVSNDYAEGCNYAACTGPGDGTVVHGNTVYLEISYNGRFAFVQLGDVNVEVCINGTWYTVTQLSSGMLVLKRGNAMLPFTG